MSTTSPGDFEHLFQNVMSANFMRAFDSNIFIHCHFKYKNMLVNSKGPDTPDAIRQRDAIFRFLLTDNFDSSLNFPNI
jgi:hypothetical protein